LSRPAETGWSCRWLLPIAGPDDELGVVFPLGRDVDEHGRDRAGERRAAGVGNDGLARVADEKSAGTVRTIRPVPMVTPPHRNTTSPPLPAPPPS
jgi:hypothetical protein